MGTSPCQNAMMFCVCGSGHLQPGHFQFRVVYPAPPSTNTRYTRRGWVLSVRPSAASHGGGSTQLELQHTHSRHFDLCVFGEWDLSYIPDHNAGLDMRNIAVICRTLIHR